MNPTAMVLHRYAVGHGTALRQSDYGSIMPHSPAFGYPEVGHTGTTRTLDRGRHSSGVRCGIFNQALFWVFGIEGFLGTEDS